jgi:hypothetical protein
MTAVYPHSFLSQDSTASKRFGMIHLSSTLSYRNSNILRYERWKVLRQGKTDYKERKINYVKHLEFKINKVPRKIISVRCLLQHKYTLFLKTFICDFSLQL